MGVITFINVITRYIIQYSFAFTEELVVSLFVWLTLFGAGIAFRDQSHLGFSLLIEKSPLRIRKIQLWIATALATILFLALIYFAIQQIGYEITFEIRSMGLDIPQWVYTIGVPVWSGLVIIRIIQGAHRASQKMKER